MLAGGGSTQSRLRSGAALHRAFPSVLPGGGGGGGGGAAHSAQSSGSCALDCYFHEADQTYYVADVLTWNVSAIAAVRLLLIAATPPLVYFEIGRAHV